MTINDPFDDEEVINAIEEAKFQIDQQQEEIKRLRERIAELEKDLEETQEDYNAVFKEMVKRGALLSKFIGVIEEEKSLVMYFNPIFLEEVFASVKDKQED